MHPYGLNIFFLKYSIGESLIDSSKKIFYYSIQYTYHKSGAIFSILKKVLGLMQFVCYNFFFMHTVFPLGVLYL